MMEPILKGRSELWPDHTTKEKNAKTCNHIANCAEAIWGEFSKR